ncbi:sterile alpha motif domain-containing protein 1-like [Nyctibius grandis]|uniref:sterile alpha motif domain-containing protein 1-like n=1 Tax=Nyctibius grandis TaxID=48427 RepID=UPI0035BBC744
MAPRPSSPPSHPVSPLTRRPGSSEGRGERPAAARAGPRQQRWGDETATVPQQPPRQGVSRSARPRAPTTPLGRAGAAHPPPARRPRRREPTRASPRAPARGGASARRASSPAAAAAPPPRARPHSPPRSAAAPCSARVLLPRTSLAASGNRARPLAAAPREVRRPPRAIGLIPCVYTRHPPIDEATARRAGRKGVAGRDRGRCRRLSGSGRRGALRLPSVGRAAAARHRTAPQRLRTRAGPGPVPLIGEELAWLRPADAKFSPGAGSAASSERTSPALARGARLRERAEGQRRGGGHRDSLRRMVAFSIEPRHSSVTSFLGDKGALGKQRDDVPGARLPRPR